MGGAEVTGAHTSVSRSEASVLAAGKETLTALEDSRSWARKVCVHLTFGLLIRSRS